MMGRPNMPARDSSGNQVSLLHAQDEDYTMVAQFEEDYDMTRSPSDQSSQSEAATPQPTPMDSLYTRTTPSDSASPPLLPPMSISMSESEVPKGYQSQPELIQRPDYIYPHPQYQPRPQHTPSYSPTHAQDQYRFPQSQYSQQYPPPSAYNTPYNGHYLGPSPQLPPALFPHAQHSHQSQYPSPPSPHQHMQLPPMRPFCERDQPAPIPPHSGNPQPAQHAPPTAQQQAVKQARKSVSPDETPEVPAKRFPCRYAESHSCNKTFTTSGHASRHAKIHTAEKMVECTHPDCFKKFTRADNMKQHLETHNKIKGRNLTRNSGVRKSRVGRQDRSNRSSLEPEAQMKRSPTQETASPVLSNRRRSDVEGFNQLLRAAEADQAL